MTQTARVFNVIRTHKYDTDSTPIDIVTLHWNGASYIWQTEPGRYSEGEDVPIDPPTAARPNITPAGSNRTEVDQ